MNEENDRLCLLQIRHILASEPQDTAALGRLTSELEALCSSLETPAESWKRDFEEHWGALEETFAVMLDRSMPAMEQESAELVSNAILDLRRLVDEALTGLSPDPNA